MEAYCASCSPPAFDAVTLIGEVGLPALFGGGLLKAVLLKYLSTRGGVPRFGFSDCLST